MFKVIVSPRVWDDFLEIFDYISRDNRDAVARFCDALLNPVDLLGTFPHIGVVSPQRPNLRFQQVVSTFELDLPYQTALS